MEQLMTFVMGHWELWLAFAVLLGFVVALEFRQQLSGVPRLSPQQVTDKINHDHAVVVDVRESTAFNTGHIQGAVNVPLDTIEDRPKQLSRLKGKSLIIACQTGQQHTAVTKLHKAGFEDLNCLAGGINAWRSANLPLVKNKQP